MAGPAPAVAATRLAVRAALSGLDPDPDPGTDPALVLVACSGGADSLALAVATAHEARAAPWRAGAVVVDHGLRAGSSQVAAAAAAHCRALRLGPVEVVRVEVVPDGSGPEAAARTARYLALDEAAARLGAVAVLLGHTLDDQAEQVLLGLARGSGARSLAAMAAVRGRYRRPFLGLDRATVRSSLADAGPGVVPHEDPTNADPATARARVRHRLLPALEDGLGPGVAAALARSAEQLREDADALDLAAADLLRRAAVGPGPLLDVAALAGHPAAVRRRALRQALVRAGCPAGGLGRGHVLAVDALVTGWRGQGPVSLPGGVRAARSSGMLSLVVPDPHDPTHP